ncbi:MAG: ATP-binding protein, partial [Thermodesulfovibrionales bacterium]|nr:ATP-binding protein [Thermodesulfovibrionales bacterium]
EELWKTISSGAVWRGELCNKKKSGELYWELALISPLYDGHGNLTNFIAIKQDITDIKLNQIEIQRRTKILEFFYSISNAFIKEETLQQSLKRCTDAMCRHLGAAISRIWLVDNEGNPTLVSQSFENLDDKECDIDTLQIGSSKVKDIIKTRSYYMTNDVMMDEGIENKEYAKRFKCNAYLGYPLVIDNEVIGVLSMFSKETLDNLTLDTVKASADTISVGIKRKQVENELKAKNKMLEDINEELRQVALREFRLRQEKERMLIQQSKMATMGEMLGMISHQWRQPLNAIALLVQNLDELDLKTEQDKVLLNETIQNVMKQIDFMSKTINDFRDFLRPQKDIVSFNPCKYIEDVLSIIHSQLKVNNIRINLRCEEKDFLIKGIPNEFMHVILNILNNAKDAIIERRAKGGLKITDEGIIGVGVLKDKDSGKTVIKIHDNGGGIPEDVLPKIFDPYFTTKHHKEGTGLGLYMVKTIVEQHLNGTIQSRNIEDGVEITITI